MHFIGGKERAREIFCHITQQQAKESLRKEAAQDNVIPLVICCGWNALSDKATHHKDYAKEQMVIHQEHQAIKSIAAKCWTLARDSANPDVLFW